MIILVINNFKKKKDQISKYKNKKLKKLLEKSDNRYKNKLNNKWSFKSLQNDLDTIIKIIKNENEKSENSNSKSLIQEHKDNKDDSTYQYNFKHSKNSPSKNRKLYIKSVQIKKNEE